MNEINKRTFAPVKSEMYQLLLCAFCYEQKLKNLGERLKKESRAFLLEEMTALRYLSNGIVLHLCNLDDDVSNWSLRSLRKAVAKLPGTQETVTTSNELLKQYRSALNKLKTKHRNEFIAHRNADEYPDPFELPDYRTSFKDLIQLALLTLECLWGAKIEFGFHLGSRDRTIDFKAELGLKA
jgi:AbiU2